MTATAHELQGITADVLAGTDGSTAVGVFVALVSATSGIDEVRSQVSEWLGASNGTDGMASFSTNSTRRGHLSLVSDATGTSFSLFLEPQQAPDRSGPPGSSDLAAR
ncbi:MAG TPA: hypothetical protein VGQ85_03350 [Candidatus Limnocylindrales bacterium]|nr:hypothetical protein [Candidatus Limnocylindrales bacterium]